MSTKPQAPPEIEAPGPKPWMALLWILTGCYAVSFVGAQGAFLGLAHGWYDTILKPRWTPPNWLFGPVWTVLYGMIGAAAYLVWRSEGRFRRSGLALFWVQLVLNGLWTWLFFAWHWLAWSLGELAVLWLLILATTILFFRQSRAAGWLTIPYLAWAAFAGALNFAIWRLNR